MTLTVSRDSVNLDVDCERFLRIESGVVRIFYFLEVKVEDCLVDFVLKKLLGESEVYYCKTFETTVPSRICGQVIKEIRKFNIGQVYFFDKMVLRNIFKSFR